jgi:hypothetical protein
VQGAKLLFDSKREVAKPPAGASRNVVEIIRRGEAKLSSLRETEAHESLWCVHDSLSEVTSCKKTIFRLKGAGGNDHAGIRKCRAIGVDGAWGGARWLILSARSGRAGQNQPQQQGENANKHRPANLQRFRCDVIVFDPLRRTMPTLRRGNICPWRQATHAPRQKLSTTDPTSDAGRAATAPCIRDKNVRPRTGQCRNLAGPSRVDGGPGYAGTVKAGVPPGPVARSMAALGSPDCNECPGRLPKNHYCARIGQAFTPCSPVHSPAPAMTSRTVYSDRKFLSPAQFAQNRIDSRTHQTFSP